MSSLALARILIVDDEADLVTALCRILEAQGYSTTGAATAEQGLHALRAAMAVDATRFDVLITDLKMPNMDGVALLRNALAVDADLVGIVMTGHGSIDTAVEAMKGGALDYILKPFNLSVAMPVLKRACAVRRLRLENAALLRQWQVAPHNSRNPIASCRSQTRISMHIARRYRMTCGGISIGSLASPSSCRLVIRTLGA